MLEVESRRVCLAILLNPTIDEINELRDCETALGMTLAGPRERAAAARRCEARDFATRSNAGGAVDHKP